MTGEPIRVLLADDHPIVRAGLRALLGAASGIRVIGEASNGAEAIAMTRTLQPHVVVMDLSMPEVNGAAAASIILSECSTVKILILSMQPPNAEVTSLLERGASGYLHKSATDRQLVDAIRAVAVGDAYFQSSAGVRAADDFPREAADRAKLDALTQREQQVLRLVAQGYSGPEIAERLSISTKTVSTYRQRIHEKIQLQHRHEYVDFALPLGLLAG